MAEKGWLEDVPAVKDVVDGTGGTPVTLPRRSQLELKGDVTVQDVSGKTRVTIAPAATAAIAELQEQISEFLSDYKASVLVATTENITLSGEQTVDGIALTAGDRVLVKHQTNAALNGVRVVSADSWPRAEDADSAEDLTSGMTIYVSEGTVNAETYWTLTTADPIVLDTTALTFEQAEASDSAPANVTKAAASAGTAKEYSRSDHKHDVTTAAPTSTGVATASGEGSATSLARSDHTHQSNTAPANVTKDTAAIGSSGEPARADHKHDIATATPVAIGAALSEGSSTSLARADHVHTNPYRSTFDTGSFEVNVPDDSITTLYSLSPTLPGQSVEFGATASDAFGHFDLTINEAGADDSAAGSECGCVVRQHWRRRNGGNIETMGAPIILSQHNFAHLLTFTDGNPALLRITKNSDYDSTLRVRVEGEAQTRTLVDP